MCTISHCLLFLMCYFACSARWSKVEFMLEIQSFIHFQLLIHPGQGHGGPRANPSMLEIVLKKLLKKKENNYKFCSMK